MNSCILGNHIVANTKRDADELGVPRSIGCIHWLGWFKSVVSRKRPTRVGHDRKYRDMYGCNIQNHPCLQLRSLHVMSEEVKYLTSILLPRGLIKLLPIVMLVAIHFYRVIPSSVDPSLDTSF